MTVNVNMDFDDLALIRYVPSYINPLDITYNVDNSTTVGYLYGIAEEIVDTSLYISSLTLSINVFNSNTDVYFLAYKTGRTTSDANKYDLKID